MEVPGSASMMKGQPGMAVVTGGADARYIATLLVGVAV